MTLREAREKALENRRAVHWGHDPRDAGVPTFEAAVEKVIAIHSPTWKNPSRMAGQWRQTLRDYADPRIGRKRVSEVATADVLAILTAHLVEQARDREGRAPADRRGDEVGRREGLPAGQPGGGRHRRRAAAQR